MQARHISRAVPASVAALVAGGVLLACSTPPAAGTDASEAGAVDATSIDGSGASDAPSSDAPAGPTTCVAMTKFDYWPIGGTMLRGANVFMGRSPGGATSGFGDADFTQADFDDLARAGANYVQISHAGIYTETPPYVLDVAARDHLDMAIAMAARAHLRAVIAYRSGPGRNENAITGRMTGTIVETIWTDSAAQDGWVRMMTETAMYYRDNPNVIGYDPMVEPNDADRRSISDPMLFYGRYGGMPEDFNRLAARVTTAIRMVDDLTPILLEPEGYGSVAFLPYLTYTGDPRTVYTVHDYTPFDYSHECCITGPTRDASCAAMPTCPTTGAPGAYPGTYDVDGVAAPVRVDRAYLDGYLETVRAYSRMHHVPVAFTEFGGHQAARDIRTYLQDRIALQDPIGNWAAWVWQPAGFADPFNMHDPSAAHDVLVAGWAGNCRPN